MILTDHGDGTRAPDPPAYRHGVLCIDAVELNTASGHYVALELPQAPYPLAGAADAVIEDVNRLGGFGIAAHADSPRPSLQWQAWDAAIDGVEWLNADNEWRDESVFGLGRLLLTYPVRGIETLASALDRPSASLARWDRLGQSRRVIGLAGADAHARLGLPQHTDSGEERLHVKVPSYVAALGMFSTRVVLGAPLSGQAAPDAAAILHAIRAGRVFTVIDGLATPGGFEVTATSGTGRAHMGDHLDLHDRVAVHVRASAPPGTTFEVLRDGASVYRSVSHEFHADGGSAPGVYRVEAHLPGTSMPWMVSNPIYVGLRGRHAAAIRAAAPAVSRAPVALERWEAESSPASASALAPGSWPDGTPSMRWDFSLGPGAPAGQYAAVHVPVGGLAGHDRVQLRVRADRPMRIWLQVRAARGGGARWGRTFYADQTPRSVELRFSEMAPIGQAAGAPPRDQIDGLLIVADTVNTRPGSAGQLAIADLWLAR